MTETVTPLVVRTPAPGVSVIELVGEVTGAARPPSQTPTTAPRQRTKAVVLDFGGLEYMNSSGIGLLVTLLVRANRMREQMLAYGLSEHYRQIFDLTRLDEAIGIHDDEAAALAAAA